MGEPFLADADGVYVVGPVLANGHWVFLCPRCDDDRYADHGEQPPVKQCTQEWLHARELTWASRTWTCWEQTPLPDRAERSKEQRFQYYRSIARELQAVGRRVQLPGCVQDKIEELHGDSTVGFQDAAEA